MDEIVKLLTEKTGLPDDKARLAVEPVIGFLKQRLPSTVGEQLNAYLSTPASQGLAEKVKGMAQGVGNNVAGTETERFHDSTTTQIQSFTEL